MEINAKIARESAEFVNNSKSDVVVVSLQYGIRESINRILNQVAYFANLGQFEALFLIPIDRDSTIESEIFKHLDGVGFEIHIFKGDSVYDVLSISW